MGGGSQNPFLFSSDLSNPFMSKVLEIEGKKKTCGRKIMKPRTRVFLTKRRASLERRQRRSAGQNISGNGIGRSVRTLKKLIPNGESKEMDALFLEAADYILALQMRVKAMQIMVNVLSAGSSNDHHE